jgi:exonuclease VII large subunit
VVTLHMARDLIDDFIARLAAHAPAVAADLAPKLERELRQQWGGTERHYLRKFEHSARKTVRLGQQLQAGATLEEAFAQAGLSRRSGFRHLAKPWKVKQA